MVGEVKFKCVKLMAGCLGASRVKSQQPLREEHRLRRFIGAALMYAGLVVLLYPLAYFAGN